MSRLVVLGCGTGVGKTRLSVALLRELALRGVPCMGLKPIESGLARHPSAAPDASLGSPNLARDAASDAEALHGAGSLQTALAHPLYGFGAPISPHLAARHEGRPIELSRIVDWVTEAERQASAAASAPARLWTVVETAGGVFSPLSLSETNFDLARQLEPAIWLLVAADSLGVLHDVSATQQAMAARGRSPDHLVLSQARPPDASTGSNAIELARLGLGVPSAVLKRHEPARIGQLIDSLLLATPAH